MRRGHECSKHERRLPGHVGFVWCMKCGHARELLRRDTWWALVDHAKDLPVLFATRRQALDSRVGKERVVKVLVQAVK